MPQFNRSGEDRRKLGELRAAMAELKSVESLTKDQWWDQWMRTQKGKSTDPMWVPHDVWTAYLKERIVILSRLYLEKKDAA
jgi:hypothetical protein